MKRVLMIVGGVLLALILCLIPVLSATANGPSYPDVKGTYVFKGNIAIYGSDSLRIRDAGKLVKCQNGTLVITDCTGGILTGTLTLENVMTSLVVVGWIGPANAKWPTLALWGEYDEECLPSTSINVVLRARVKLSNTGVVTGLRAIKVQGMNSQTLSERIFEGGLICKSFTPPQ